MSIMNYSLLADILLVKCLSLESSAEYYWALDRCERIDSSHHMMKQSSDGKCWYSCAFPPEEYLDELTRSKIFCSM